MGDAELSAAAISLVWRPIPASLNAAARGPAPSSYSTTIHSSMPLPFNLDIRTRRTLEAGMRKLSFFDVKAMASPEMLRSPEARYGTIAPPSWGVRYQTPVKSFGESTAPDPPEAGADSWAGASTGPTRSPARITNPFMATRIAPTTADLAEQFIVDLAEGPNTRAWRDRYALRSVAGALRRSPVLFVD